MDGWFLFKRQHWNGHHVRKKRSSKTQPPFLKDYLPRSKYKQWESARALLCVRPIGHFRAVLCVTKASWWQMVRLSLRIFHLNMTAYMEMSCDHWGFSKCPLVIKTNGNDFLLGAWSSFKDLSLCIKSLYYFARTVNNGQIQWISHCIYNN